MPPTAPAIKTSAKSKIPQGLWRDGPYLVIHRSLNRLPDRCVKTNKAEATEQVEWTFQWRPVNTGLAVGASLLTGGLSEHLVELSAQEMPLSITVDKSYMLAKRRANIISGGLVGVGIVVTIMALPILLALQTIAPLLAMSLGGLVGLGGIAIVGAGGVMMLQQSDIILTIKHMTKELAWFTGAHPDYLASLPALPATHSITAPAR